MTNGHSTKMFESRFREYVSRIYEECGGDIVEAVVKAKEAVDDPVIHDAIEEMLCEQAESIVYQLQYRKNVAVKQNAQQKMTARAGEVFTDSDRIRARSAADTLPARDEPVCENDSKRVSAGREQVAVLKSPAVRKSIAQVYMFSVKGRVLGTMTRDDLLSYMEVFRDDADQARRMSKLLGVLSERVKNGQTVRDSVPADELQKLIDEYTCA